MFALTALLIAQCCIHVHSVKNELPNIVLVITDDQDVVLKGLVPMRKTIKLIQEEGVTFTNAYGHNDGGGAKHVPPGWDSWVGLIGNSKYYNYSLSINGKKQYFSKEYLNNVLKSYSTAFLKEQQNSTMPFLMVVAPPAPHQPSTPEQKYNGYFEGVRVPRNIQYNHYNNSDKHWLAHMKSLPLPTSVLNTLDEMYARRWESLLSVDDLVEEIIKSLNWINQLNNTFIIFTSDNGFHLGQFSFPWDKRQMYEFDIRVPLLIRGPGIPKNTSVSNLIIIPDIAPTLLHLGAVNGKIMDGKSFLPISRQTTRTVPIEYHGEGSSNENMDCGYHDNNLYGCAKTADCRCQDSRNNTYFCLRSISRANNFIYCKFSEIKRYWEAYNIRNDPFQMENTAYKLNTLCKKKLNLLLDLMLKCNGKTCSQNLKGKNDCRRFLH